MKVLWICGSVVIGGAERATVEVVRGLRERGHAIEVLCLQGAPFASALAGAGLTVQRAPLGGSLNVRSFFSIARAYRDSAPDIVLVTTIDEWVRACLTKRRRSEPRLVLARHMILPVNRGLAWLVNRRADAVIAVSDAVRRSLVCDSRIAPERVHVIHNASRFPPRDAVPTHAERCRARVALGLDPSGHWVGFFGGLNAAKGIDDVLTAVRRANDEIGPTHVFVCGRGDERETARTLHRVNALCLDDRFRRLGDIDRVAEAMLAADVVVMATRNRLGEACPLTVIEAMACGTPLLAYATGGVPEVIGDDGGAGLLAPPDDAAELGRLLVAFLGDAAAAQQLAANGVNRVRNCFLPEQATERYERLFLALRGLMAKPQSGGAATKWIPSPPRRGSG